MNKRQREVELYKLDQESAALKQLEQQYRLALEDVKLTIRLLQADEQTQSKIHSINYQKMLEKQLEGALEKLHMGEYKSISKFLNDSYNTGYVGTMYDLHGQGIPIISPIDHNAAVKAIQLDTKLSDRKIHESLNGELVTLYESLGVDVDDLKKTIRKEITRGIASGMKYDDIARNISFVSKAPLSRAKTIVRTEGHRIQQQSAEDARQTAKAKGADVVKQWDSTMDGATRENHRILDGKIVEVNERFKIGKYEPRFPGDFGDPAEDCNCRCVALTRARRSLDAAELETLKERAAYFKLDKSEDFADFEKKYLKAAEAPAAPEIKDALDFGYGDFTGDDYIKWVEHYDEINKDVHLSAKELEVIDNYTEGAYISYNAVSRGQEDTLSKHGYTPEDIVRSRKDAGILEGALAKYDLDTDIVTHRFERDVSWLTGNGNDVASLEKLVGTQYTASGFTSSGMLPNRFRFTGGKPDAVHFEIVTPKGTNGAYLSMSKKGEEEFLYNRNTRFVVLDSGERIVKETKYNYKTMQMEEVEVTERFLKVQVVTDAPKDNAAMAIGVKGKAATIKTQTQMETVVEQKRQPTATYTPAKDIKEAEGVMWKYCDDKQYGALGVSYNGIGLDVANEINKTLVPLFGTFDVGKIGGIVAPAGNTKLGKQMSGAVAGYSPVRKSFVLNRKTLKSMKTAQAAFDAEGAALRNLLDHPEEYDFTKLSKTVLSIVDRSKKSGRATVPRTVGEALQHEFGHFIERKVYASDLWVEAERNMPKYSDAISGYAGTSKGEYVAESFVSYMKGENVVDPVLVRIFDGLRR